MNQNTKHTTRPDQPLFFVMMGVFFLLLAIAPANWSYYTFGEFGRATATAGKFQASSEQFMTPNERKERKDRIALWTSLVSRHRLEAILSGAGALGLFGIALRFFRNALRGRKIKNYYENIDWNIIPMPSSRIEVRQKRLYDVLFAFVVIFFGGMILLMNNKITNSSVILSVSILAFLSVFCFLMIRAKRQTVRRFDASGITRGDGRQFAWNDFCGVVPRIDINYAREKYAWRVELAFAGGEAAWIIPHRIKNAEEVFKYISRLPHAVLKT